jgi:hypothetical protein
MASGKVQTVNAVTSTICSIDLSSFAGFNADNFSLFAYAICAGRSGGNNLTSFRSDAAFKRIAGVVTQVGTTTNQSSYIAAALAGTDMLINLSGNVIRVQGVGIASATIDWGAVLSLTTSPF